MGAGPGNQEPPLVRYGRDVVRAALVDLTGKALVFVAGSFAAVAALLVLRGGSIPVWSALLLILAALLVGLLARRRTKGALEGRLAALETRVRAAKADNDALASALESHETYSRHVAQSLDALQRVVSGDIGATIPHYIEQAILAPARDLLMEKPVQNVRLSVLLPDPADDTRWKMAFASGHSLTGQAKYHEPIVHTVSRFAYEEGAPQHWPDVSREPRFRDNPHASAPIRSMVSLPIRWGDAPLGVFNAVSSEPNAFDPVEITYLTSLGGVIAAAVSFHAQAASEGAGSDPRIG